MSANKICARCRHFSAHGSLDTGTCTAPVPWWLESAKSGLPDLASDHGDIKVYAQINGSSLLAGMCSAFDAGHGL